MSNRIHKSRIPIKASISLPPDAKEALIEVKKELRNGLTPRPFGNNQGAYDGDGSPLPKLDKGCIYLELQVGQSRDLKPNAGKKRFVFEFDISSRKVREVYYTENHYLKRSFFRIV